jgi:hypothetical protein
MERFGFFYFLGSALACTAANIETTAQIKQFCAVVGAASELGWGIRVITADHCADRFRKSAQWSLLARMDTNIFPRPQARRPGHQPQALSLGASDTDNRLWWAEMLASAK